jgi:hypothetical protein
MAVARHDIAPAKIALPLTLVEVIAPALHFDDDPSL